MRRILLACTTALVLVGCADRTTLTDGLARAASGDATPATRRVVDHGGLTFEVQDRRSGRPVKTATIDFARHRVAFHGVDRVVLRDGSHYVVLRPRGTGDDATVTTDRLVLQDSRTQSGLRIRTAATQVLSVTFGDDTVVLAAADGDGSAVLSHDAFRGDAMLALEAARPAHTTVAAAPPVDSSSTETPPRLALRSPGSDAPRGAREVDDARRESIFGLFDDRRRAFRPLRADPREAALRLGILYDNHSDTMFDFGIGGDLGLYRRDVYDGNLTLSGRGQIVSRFQFNSESFDLLNTDFIGGAALGWARGEHEMELYFYHVSSHLGDEKLDFGERDRVNYARESLRFLYSRQLGPWRLYGGPTVTLSGDDVATENRVTLQLGTEVDFMLWEVPMYAGLDLQGRQTNDFRPNVTTVLGLKLGNPAERDPVRLYLEFFDGYSNMGQYFDERERYIMGGLGYDF